MGSSSDEESDISDSEIQEYKEIPYELLKARTYNIRGRNGALRCPFCVGKKKTEYQYNHLYQHAIGVSKGTAKSPKQRANHLALATYLEVDLANEFALQPIQKAPEPVPAAANKLQNDLYCWPWVGVIVNIVGIPAEGDFSYWMNKFSEYNPVGVEIFRDDCRPATQGVVRFASVLTGFDSAIEFENYFKRVGKSKKEFEQEMSPGPDIYGWFAREGDYNSEGPVGDYLRQNGELKSSNLEGLLDEIGQKSDVLNQMQIDYNEKSMLFDRMLEEHDMLHHSFFEGL